MVILVQYRHGYQREHDISAWDVEVHSDKSYNLGQYPFSLSCILLSILKMMRLMGYLFRLDHSVRITPPHSCWKQAAVPLASIYPVFLPQQRRRGIFAAAPVSYSLQGKGMPCLNYFPSPLFPTLQIVSPPSAASSRKSICARGGTL